MKKGSKNIIAILSIATFVLFTGCGPRIVVVNNKEKVIERNAPPLPGIKRDVFAYGKPTGKANVLWVVDNTRGSEMLFEKRKVDENGKRLEKPMSRFEQGYEHVVNGMPSKKGDKSLGVVDFRSQVVASPSGKAPANYLRGQASKKEHLSDLFNVPQRKDEFDQGLFISSRESIRGDIRDESFATPFETVLTGVKEPAFEGRDKENIYVIFVQAGRHSNPLVKDAKEYAAEAFPKKLIGRVDVFNVVPGMDVKCPGAAFRPETFLLEQLKVGWTISSAEGEVCQSNPTVWGDAILNWIRKGQSEMRLSFDPSNLETMQVRSTQRRLILNEEYTYDADRNRIVLGKDISADGELWSVSYQYDAPDELEGN